MSHNTESVIKAGGYSADESRAHAATAWRRYELTRNQMAQRGLAPRIVDPVPPVRDQSEDRTQPRFVVAYFPDGKVGYGDGKWGVLRADNLELYDGMFVNAEQATKAAVGREQLYITRGGY